MTNLQNTVAIEPGDAKGIGKAVVKRFGRLGAAVVVTDIDSDGSFEVVAEANKLQSSDVIYADTLETLVKVTEAPKRKAGVKVAELVSKLKNEAGVI